MKIMQLGHELPDEDSGAKRQMQICRWKDTTIYQHTTQKEMQLERAHR